MTITLPLPPNLGNGRLHWRTKQAKRRAYQTNALILMAMESKIPAKPLPKARVTATLYVHQRMDADNLFARLKWPLDCLVRSGWLEDDGPDHLEWAAMPTQVVDRKNPRIEITLEAA
jgi:Holliday junction resolvase RusA-like endonuclease